MKVEIVEIQNEKGLQAIHLPKEFSIDDDKVYLKKTGNIISIIPYHSRWQNLFDSLDQFSNDFMNERAQPNQPKRESFN